MSRLTIHADVPTLKLSDALVDASRLIQETRLGGLPIVERDKLAGTLLERDVATLVDANEKNWHRPLSSFPLYAPITLERDAHPYRAISLFGKIQHDFLPVVDKEMNYYGVALRDEAMREFFERFHLSEDASLLEIEAPAQFRLSDLIRLLEQNETTVLSLSTRRSDENENAQLIALQLQTPDAFRLQRTLERYGYVVVYNSHPSSLYEDDLARKAQAFLRYLEM